MPSSSPSPASNSALPARPWVERAPWPSLAVLLGSGLYLRLFYHLPGRLDDEGLILAGADRILQGQIPFRDFFSELGPASFYLEAAIFKLLGTNLDSFRLTAWLVGVVSAWLLYFLSKRILKGAVAFLPPLLFITISYAHNYGVSHHWWSSLFFLVTVACLAAHTAPTLSPGGWRQKLLLFTAGLLAAATLLAMQSKGAWAILVGLIFLFWAEKMRRGSDLGKALRNGFAQSLWFLSGVAILLGVAVGYFWAHGALREWFFDNAVFLFTNYWSYQTPPHAYSWERFTHLMGYLLRNLSPNALRQVVTYYFFSVVGPVIAFGGVAWQLRAARRPEPSQARFLLLYLFAGLGALFSELHAPDVTHMVWASPLMLLLAVYSCQSGVRRWHGRRGFLIAGAFVVIFFVILGILRTVTQAASFNTPIATRRGTLFATAATAGDIERWVSAIQNAVPPGRDTFVFPYRAQLYFLTATRNPTRYDVLLPGFHSPAQIAEAMRALQAHPPTCIFSFDRLQRMTFRTHFPDDVPDIFDPHPVEQMLIKPESPYRLAEEVAGLEVWVLKR